MNGKLQAIQERLQRRAGQLETLRRQHRERKQSVARLQAERDAIARATEIIQVVAKLTQQELEIHVSELATLALAAVFPDPYRLALRFELRRNRSEADLLLVDGDDNNIQPMDASGGGVVDIAALALRISLWSLKQPHARPLLGLDEPCRFVSRDLQGRASAMIREVSKRLGIQFLIVTHEETLAEAADKTFRVSKAKGVSRVEEMK